MVESGGSEAAVTSMKYSQEDVASSACRMMAYITVDRWGGGGWSYQLMM